MPRLALVAVLVATLAGCERNSPPARSRPDPPVRADPPPPARARHATHEHEHGPHPHPRHEHHHHFHPHPHLVGPAGHHHPY